MIRRFFNELRSAATWKKVLIAAIIILSLIRIFYVAVRSDVRRTSSPSVTYDLSDPSYVECNGLKQTFKSDKGRLEYLEFMFTSVPSDKEGKIILNIFKGDKDIYSAELSLENIVDGEWKKVFINCEIESGCEYQILLTANEDCTYAPFVLTAGGSYAPEIISSSANDAALDRQIAVNYYFIEPVSISDRLVTVSLWIWFMLIATVAIVKADIAAEKITAATGVLKSKVGSKVFAVCLELLMCGVIVFNSGIEFQDSTIVVLLLISLLAVIGNEEHIEFAKTLTDKTWKKALLYALYVYAAFALTGQRLFIYPINKSVNFTDILTFIAAIIWFIPIVNSFLFYMDKLGARVFENRKKMKTGLFVAVVLLILLVPVEYNLYINNPCISSVDTVDTMVVNAKHLRGMYDWHPFFYCFLTKILLSIWDSTYILVFAQHIMYAYVITEIFLYLRKKGFSDAVLIVIALFFGFNASNILQVNTIWKDIPYGLALLWLMIIIAKLTIDREEYRKKIFIYLELIIALTLTDLLRKNGFVPAIIAVAFLIPILIKNIRVVFSILMSICIIFCVQMPLRTYYEVESTGSTGIHIGLGQDILGAYYAGGEVSEKTSKIVEDMTIQNTAEYQYYPTWSKQSYYIDPSTGEFIVSYIDTFFKNPVLVTRSVLAREDAYWNIYEGEDAILSCVCYSDTMDGRTSEGYYWNDYYPARKYVSLYPQITNACLLTHFTQWIEAFVWRSGLLTLMAFMSIVLLILKRKDKGIWAILSPATGQILGLLLSTGWSEFRYYWGINLMNTTFVLLTLVILHGKVSVKAEEVKESEPSK